MRKRRRIWVAIVLGALALGAVFFPERPHEPIYNGQPLSYWLNKWAYQNNDPQQKEKVLTEIRADTNAIPYLMKWMRYTRPARKVRGYVAASLSYLHYDLGRYVFEKWVVELPAQRGALYVLADMGAKASSAIPELEQLIHSPDYEAGRRAEYALENLGEVSVPALARGLTNPSFAFRAWAAQCLMNQATNARSAIPQLKEALADPNPMVAMRACDALLKLSVDPEIILPRLVQWLGDPNPQIRVAAASQLKDLSPGKNAFSVVPVLKAALQDDEPRVRRLVADALQAIAPEALTNRSPPEVSF